LVCHHQLRKHSLLSPSTNGCYADFANIPFSAFADAALFRACGVHVAAMQPVSPKQPLNLVVRRQIKKIPSRHGAGISEAWTNWIFVAVVEMAVFARTNRGLLRWLAPISGAWDWDEMSQTIGHFISPSRREDMPRRGHPHLCPPARVETLLHAGGQPAVQRHVRSLCEDARARLRPCGPFA